MLWTWKVDHVQLKKLLAEWSTEQPKKTPVKKATKSKKK